MGVEPAYETIGATYGATRDQDPRIARRIRKALGDAESVVNIGLGEIRRVARRRAVSFTCDPAFHDFWLFRDYFPSFVAHARTRLPSLHAYEPLGPLKVIAVPIPGDCRDGFAAAYSARPAAYLDPVCRANISGFHFIPRRSCGPGCAGSRPTSTAARGTESTPSPAATRSTAATGWSSRSSPGRTASAAGDDRSASGARFQVRDAYRRLTCCRGDRASGQGRDPPAPAGRRCSS